MDSRHDHGSFLHHHPTTAPSSRGRLIARFFVAAFILAVALSMACSVIVSTGEAVVVTSFGDPVRVLTSPGLYWKIPAPVETVITVDMRLRTTSSGLQDVGTRDGLRMLVQAFVAWRVPPDPEDIKLFLRSVRGDPDEAARQLRSFVGASLQVGASSFDFSDLVNTDPAKLRLADLEARLQGQLAGPLRANFGMAILRVGIERLTLPEATLAATVARMRSERETVAAERTAEGLREAAAIRSKAARDGRITVAEAQTKAAEIEAKSRKIAADIQATAYDADPDLYVMLRSLDTLSTVIGPGTHLVLRTDAAPFSALVTGPPGRLAPK
jgi:membrane protease subunit HflC